MRALSTALAVLLALAACGRQSSPEQSAGNAGTTPPASVAAFTVTPMTVPASAGASEPQLTSSAKGSILSWVEQDGATAALKFAQREGSGWSTPQTVASGTDWFLSDADPPLVHRLANGSLVAAWYRATNIQLEAYDTWMAYSTDEGKTWSKPFKPYSDRTQTQHGFVSVFDQPGGGLGLVWLDAREWELNQDAPDGGSVMLRSASFDPSWKQTSDQVANLRVCDCCQTSVAATPDGIVVAFRDRTEDEIRDIHVTRLENGKWTDAVPVHQDNWEIDSCPVNGPAISANGRSLAVAWFTAASGEGHAFAAFSPDAGRTWGAPVRLDEQTSTGRVDVEMLDDGSAVASWVEFADGRGQLKARRIMPDGSTSPAVAVQGPDAGRVGGFPRMVRQGDELAFVWTETAAGDGEHAEHGGPVQMKGAVARLR